MSLYSPAGRTTNSVNGASNMSAGSGTINPAALSGGAVLHPSNSDPSPRGTKRSRSPDDYGSYVQTDDNDDSKGRLKRNRLSKTPRTSGDFTADQLGSLPTPATTSSDITHTPHVNSQNPNVPPAQTSPVLKATPTKSTLKALPTVRDHTSDQLGPEGDEYIAREFDDAGEQKVDAMGYLQGNREYKIRTFILPGRGQKLFMLATECARTLQYRDSYLLFNKNRSLFKIIASPKEKEDLVAKDILPYSYRSRQIAIVTARSMFRQFGSRVIKDGRRVRDDYWEAKARKQGFTEDDPAGEKRPGATRAREAAAAEALGARQLAAYGDIVYSNGPTFGAIQPPSLPPGVTSSIAQMPMMEAYDSKYRDISRPRQELTGPPYADLTRPSSDAELASQSTHASEFSKTINTQGRYRKNIVEEYWNRPHDPPITTPQTQTVEPVTSNQPFQSPRFSNSDSHSQASNLLPQQSNHSSMNPPSFAHHQNPGQSPLRQSSVSQGYGRDHAQFTPSHPTYPRSSSNLSISQTPTQQQTMQYGAFSPHVMNPPHQQAWGQPPHQTHQSPAMSNRMFNPSQSSPHATQGQILSPMQGAGHSQSPHPQQQMHPSQMFPQGMGGNMGNQQHLVGPGAGLRALGAAGYGQMGLPQQGMYGMGGPAGHFVQQQQQQQQSQQQAQQNWASSAPGPGWQGYQ